MMPQRRHKVHTVGVLQKPISNIGGAFRVMAIGEGQDASTIRNLDG